MISSMSILWALVMVQVAKGWARYSSQWQVTCTCTYFILFPISGWAFRSSSLYCLKHCFCPVELLPSLLQSTAQSGSKRPKTVFWCLPWTKSHRNAKIGCPTPTCFSFFSEAVFLIRPGCWKFFSFFHRTWVRSLSDHCLDVYPCNWLTISC